MRALATFSVFAAFLALTAFACKDQSGQESPPTTPKPTATPAQTPAATPKPTPAVTPEPTTTPKPLSTDQVPVPAPDPTPTAATAGPNPVVVMKTSMGTIEIELDPKRAPITAKNFLSYVDDGYFDGTIFHRVISNFMIQGGGFTPDLKKRNTKPPIKLEANNGLSNVRGTIAMARTGNPDSATAQFFINVQDNSGGLNPRPGSAGYAVFGRVVSGMDVVDKIRVVPTAMKRATSGQLFKNLPVQTVTIESVTRRK